MRQFALILVIGLCLGAIAPELAAAPPAEKPGAHATLKLELLKKELESGDEDRVLGALEQIREAEDRNAAPLVDALLNRGASSRPLLEAIEVAGVLGKESSSAALAPYVKHRTPEVRRAAAQSLLHTKGKLAVQALREALRQSDAELRGSAAEELGALGAKDAVPDLFAVLPKEVPEAAGAIGTLCSADECQTFLGYLGKLPFDVMQSGFLPMLLRTGSDVPDAVKISLIEQLRRMATPKSSEVLSTALASYPANASPKVKLALDAAVHNHSVKSEDQ